MTIKHMIFPVFYFLHLPLLIVLFQPRHIPVTYSFPILLLIVLDLQWNVLWWSWQEQLYGRLRMSWKSKNDSCEHLLHRSFTSLSARYFSILAFDPLGLTTTEPRMLVFGCETSPGLKMGTTYVSFSVQKVTLLALFLITEMAGVWDALGCPGRVWVITL